jgi:hypothetical protein
VHAEVQGVVGWQHAGRIATRVPRSGLDSNAWCRAVCARTTHRRKRAHTENEKPASQ